MPHLAANGVFTVSKINPVTRWRGFFLRIERPMTTATISAQLASDLGDCLRRLRIAHATGDEREERVLEMRLNWLLDKVDRKATPC